MSEEARLNRSEQDDDAKLDLEMPLSADQDDEEEAFKPSVTVINANLEMYQDEEDLEGQDAEEEEENEQYERDEPALDNRSSNYDRLLKAEELESFQQATAGQIQSERGHVESRPHEANRPYSQGARRVDMSTEMPTFHEELYLATRESMEAAEPQATATKADHSSNLSTTRANLEPSATVKFQLAPLNQVVTQAFPLNTKLKEMREKFAADLKMEPKYLRLFFDFDSKGELKPLDHDHMHLSELGVEANGIVGFRVESVDQARYPLKAYEQREKDLLMPADVITVNVTLSSGVTREVIVEIVRPQHKKPFLGGFRHKYNNQVYLNASSQTQRRFDANKLKNKLCRDTQTVLSHHIKLQTRQDMSTQMTKPGVFVSRVQDKLLTPRPYQTADQLHQIRVTSCVVIQKYFRRWLAKKRFNVIKLAYQERVRWEKEKELARLREIEQRRQMDINRRLNPRTKDDFEILYAALEKWRNEELTKINATKTGAARKAALAVLVDQEAELIATIERYKIEANKEIREKQVHQLLQKMSEPKIWKCKDGSKTELDTPYNIRAKELKDIYNSLNMKFLTQDERLDVLLTLKHTVQEHDCKLTQEITKLIDREADLLMRGIKEENLNGLRQRVSSLFLQYIKTPQFNPAIAKHLKVPQDIDDNKFSLENFYCTTCGRYLPSIEFQISSTNTKVGKCRMCKNVENLAIKRVDYTKFKFLLNKIQIDEKNFETMFMTRPHALSAGPDGDNYKKSRICYLLTDRDIHYLFDKIWNSQSILSANQDIYQLHFVRWNRNEEWAPWNTILLTLDEADSHLKLTNLELNYGEPFIKKIRQRHVMARNYFSKLPKIAEHLKRNEPVSEPIHLPSLTGIKIQ